MLHVVSHNIVAQKVPCSLMNNPMKATVELNASSKLVQQFNNAKGSLLVVHTLFDRL